MKIQIKLLATYRKYLPPGTPSSTYEMEVAPGTQIEELLPQLPVPEDYHSVVLINGKGPRPGQALQEGDVVCLFPAIAGG